MAIIFLQVIYQCSQIIVDDLYVLVIWATMKNDVNAMYKGCTCLYPTPKMTLYDLQP